MEINKQLQVNLTIYIDKQNNNSNNNNNNNNINPNNLINKLDVYYDESGTNLYSKNNNEIIGEQWDICSVKKERKETQNVYGFIKLINSFKGQVITFPTEFIPNGTYCKYCDVTPELKNSQKFHKFTCNVPNSSSLFFTYKGIIKYVECQKNKRFSIFRNILYDSYDHSKRSLKTLKKNFKTDIVFLEYGQIDSNIKNVLRLYYNTKLNKGIDISISSDTINIHSNPIEISNDDKIISGVTFYKKVLNLLEIDRIKNIRITDLCYMIKLNNIINFNKFHNYFTNFKTHQFKNKYIYTIDNDIVDDKSARISILKSILINKETIIPENYMFKLIIYQSNIHIHIVIIMQL